MFKHDETSHFIELFYSYQIFKTNCQRLAYRHLEECL